MLYRIWRLAVKELIQLLRDRLLGPFVLLGPLTELLLVAWSTSQGIEHLPTAVLDMDHSAASRGLIEAMINTETFDPFLVETQDQLTSDIARGNALVAWVIPRGFEAQLQDASARAPGIQLILDGADAVASQTAAQVAQGVVASYGGQVAGHYEAGYDFKAVKTSDTIKSFLMHRMNGLGCVPSIRLEYQQPERMPT